MEASLKTDKPEIYVMICRTEDTLSFNIGNSVMNGIKEINTDTQTTKEDSRKHGYGLKNVKNSAEACGGFCLINYENGIYSVTVIIPEKKRKQYT